MKITFCAYDKPNNVGGPVTWLQHLLVGLKKEGFDVACLIFYHVGNTGPFTEYLIQNKISFKGREFQYYAEDNITWLLQELNKNIPDIFVPNLVVPAYLATPWIKKAGIKVIGISHSDDPFYHAIQKEFVDGNDSFRINGMVVVSKELEQQLCQSDYIDKLALKRIPYGVKIPKEKASVVQGEPLRMVYVGRLSEEQKCISKVAHAFCDVVDQVKGVEAIIYGDGPDKSNVVSIFQDKGNSLAVSLGGNIPSELVQEKLLETHIIVLLSEYEGLPISILEAMACGVVPVCLEMRSGITEQINNGITGYIVKDRNQDFIQTISKIKSDSEHWEFLSTNAKELIEENFSLASSNQSYIDFFNSFSKNSTLSQIRITEKIDLPPVNPFLARADRRKPKQSLLKKIRIKVGAIKQKIF